MNRIMRVAGVLCILFALNSCYWDNPPEPTPIDPSLISFNTHVMPIFNESCNMSGCHDDTHAPDLREENAWQAIHSGGYVNLTFPEESGLYKSVVNGGMPPVGSLSETEKEVILAWIKKGALND